MENAVIYARVSTQGQDYERQVEELRAYAQRNDYQIVAEFTEKISGAKRWMSATPCRKCWTLLPVTM